MNLKELMELTQLEQAYYKSGDKMVKFFNGLYDYRVVKYTRSAVDFLAVVCKRGRYTLVRYGISTAMHAGFHTHGAVAQDLIRGYAGMPQDEGAVMHVYLRNPDLIEHGLRVLDLYAARPLTETWADPDELAVVEKKSKAYQRKYENLLRLKVARMCCDYEGSLRIVSVDGLFFKRIKKTGEIIAEQEFYYSDTSNAESFKYLDIPSPYRQGWNSSGVREPLQALLAAKSPTKACHTGVTSWTVALLDAEELDTTHLDELILYYKSRALVNCLDSEEGTAAPLPTDVDEADMDKYRAKLEEIEKVVIPGL